jgi:single-strand DNA-binding protein
MYNKIILAGNLTRDIEIKYTSGGMAIATVGLASNRKFKSQTGEQKEEVLFVDVTFFGRQAEIVNQYLRKGSRILVDGRLKLDQWTAQDGSKRSKHSITAESMTMLDTKGTNPSDVQMGGNGYSQQGGSDYSAPAQNNYSQPAQSAPKAAPQPTSNIPEIDINEDEIPF